jgi:aspartyl/asparaginyl-tRNA synthetase
MTMEFLREIPHMRVRTNTFMAVFRVRSLLAHAIHTFFQERDFVYVHTPIITSADAEGAGELFRISTIEPKDYKYDKEGNVVWSEELLGTRSTWSHFVCLSATFIPLGRPSGQRIPTRPSMPTSFG